MCGIVGYITDKPAVDNYVFLTRLLYLAADRGTDATGVAITTKDNINIVKEAIPSDKFIKKHFGTLREAITKSSVILGHTRAATQGHQKDNNNNHPIHSESYIMVHNGICPSMDRIKGYPYKGEVDSEILLSYIEKNGIVKGLPELQGSA